MFKIFFGAKQAAAPSGALTCAMAGTSSLAVSITLFGTATLSGSGSLSGTLGGYSYITAAMAGSGALSYYNSLTVECFDPGTFQDNPNAFYIIPPFQHAIWSGVGILTAIVSSTTSWAPTDCFEPGTFQDHPNAFYDPELQKTEIDGVGYLVGILETITAPIAPPPVPVPASHGGGSGPAHPASHPVPGWAVVVSGKVVRVPARSNRL